MQDIENPMVREQHEPKIVVHDIYNTEILEGMCYYRINGNIIHYDNLHVYFNPYMHIAEEELIHDLFSKDLENILTKEFDRRGI